MRRRTRFFAIMFLLCVLGLMASAQSPNTATLVVVVIDQSGAVITDATVSVVDTMTGAMRNAASRSIGEATNTTEPDGNGAGQNDFNQLGPQYETAPSLLDQRHRAVVNLTYRLPWPITAGTITQVASAKPFNHTTGVVNNGDRNNNDRPVINGQVVGRYSFRGTPTSDVSIFAEKRISLSERTLLLRIELPAFLGGSSPGHIASVPFFIS